MSYGYDPFLSEARSATGALTSTFAFRTAEDGAAYFDIVAVASRRRRHRGRLVYSRFNHPNLEIVEDRLALLDGAEGASHLQPACGDRHRAADFPQPASRSSTRRRCTAAPRR